MNPDNRTACRLDEIVARFGGELIGDGATRVSQIAPLAKAQAGQLSFLTHARNRSQLQATGASAVIVGPDARDATDLPRIVCANPHAYFARVLAFFNPPPPAAAGVHETAVVDPTAVVASSACIGPLAVIGRNARIGSGSIVSAGCFVGDNVAIGEDSRLHPHVTVYHDCRIGSRVILHSGAVIGADGFGLAQEDGRWLKIPQLGGVSIGDDVEIGANTTVDRGALEDTVIEEGVKLDNLIQVAHNVRIGAHTAMAGCVGIAGSAKIGRQCTVGGAAMILGHLEIADQVNISAATLVAKSITQPGTYTSALPFMPHQAWLKNAAHLRHLDSLVERIRRLEQRLTELERSTP